MKGLPKYLILIILPAFLFITSRIIKDAQGPYYLNFSDPSYAYLISSLNLARGFNIVYTDHPGTTVQVIGAITIKVYYLLSNKNTDLARDVLMRPEDYLLFMNGVLIMINCIILFLLGYVTFRLSNKLMLALLLQLSPFVSWEIFYGLIIVAPDNLLVGISACFLILIVYYFYKIDEKNNTPLYFVILFAVVSGFGLATKLNFLPMIIIPLVLVKKFKNKLTFIITSAVSFLIFVYPVISNYPVFFNWLSRLAMNSGVHGTGSSNVIDKSSFFNNVILIFTENYLFLFAYMLIILTLSVTYLNKKTIESSFHFAFKKYRLILLTIISSMSLLVFIMSKHYNQYYLVPAIMLCTISISICAKINYEIYKNKLPKLMYIEILLIILLSVWSIWGIEEVYFIIKDKKAEAYTVLNYIGKNYPDAFIINELPTAGKQCAMAFSLNYAGDQYNNYRTELTEILPFQLYYNRGENKIYSMNEGNSVREYLSLNKKIILKCVPSSPAPEIIKEKINSILEVKNTSCKKVFENKYYESVYEIYPGIKMHE